MPDTKSGGVAVAMQFCALAAWAGLLAGLAEGIVFLLARNYPLINASHKVPIEGMWIAPLFETLVWCVAGCFVALPLLWGPVAIRWRQYLLVVCFGMVFAGASLVLLAPRVIHTYGALTLAAGVAAGVCRQLAGREASLLTWVQKRIILVPLTVLGCFLLVTLGAWATEQYSLARLPPAEPDAPNVIVMVLDTVRWDRLAPASPLKADTPELDRIAGESTLFLNAWTTGPWSLPSQTSLLTGRDPSDHGGDWNRGKLRPGILTLGDYLQGQGYVTAAFSGNTSWVTTEYLGQGFQYFQPVRVLKVVLRLTLGRWVAKHLPKGAWQGPLAQPAESVNAEFFHWSGKRAGRPFFAYLCYMDVNNSGHDEILHLPEQANVLYREALKTLDQRVGELDRELEKRGQRENTILIVTSDHGESFGRRAADHEETLHMSSVYPEQMRVPLMIRWPKKLAGGAVSRQTVSLKQIPATIEQLMKGKATVFPAPIDATGSASADPGCVFGELRELHGRRTQAMVVCDTWQFIRREKAEELYDLASDPGAHTNRIDSAELAPQRDRMRSLLHQWLEQQDEAAVRR